MPSPANLVRRLKRGLDVPQEIAEGIFERTTPVVQLGDVQKWWTHDGFEVIPCTGWSDSSAVASNYSHCILENPSNSNTDVLLERFHFQATNPLGNIRWGLASDGGGAVGTDQSGQKLIRDSRYVELGAVATLKPVAKVRDYQNTGFLAGVQPGYQQLINNATTDAQKMWPWEKEQRWYLRPGWSFVMYNATVNARLVAGFSWLELRVPR